MLFAIVSMLHPFYIFKRRFAVRSVFRLDICVWLVRVYSHECVCECTSV